MTQQQRVIDAIKQSGVQCIAIVDDAFDPPQFAEAQGGILLEFLEMEGAEDTRMAANISENLWKDAVSAIQRTDFVSKNIRDVVAALYAAYMKDLNEQFDPGGQFKILKGANLENIRPLLTLMAMCKPDINVRTFGAESGGGDNEVQVDAVFVDLYLDQGVSATEDPSSSVSVSAVDASIKRIAPFMISAPAVILMSSHAGQAKAVDYRGSINGGAVYASRFGFIEKTKITCSHDSNVIQVEHEACDVLLDIFQGYKFGRGLHSALEMWRDSAKMAVENLVKDIDGLELRDIAYLVRFRLEGEGQSLPDYLEWLLTECLVDEVGKQMDKREKTPDFCHLTSAEAKKIEGAFDGPTDNIARLYHRVRIEDKRKNPREHFRIGDLYLLTAGETEYVRAVMNPSCDLVVRPPKNRRAAETLLTIRGDLEEFDGPATSVGDFIIVNDRPRNISWKYKAIETLQFSGAYEVPGGGGSEDPNCVYLGALRPLYAQEIQKKFLSDLGRVGVAVPPALAFAASVRLSYCEKGGQLKELPLGDASETLCYVVPPPRSGKSGSAVFKRKFVRVFLRVIKGLDRSKMPDEAVSHLEHLRKEDAEMMLRKTISAGIQLEHSVACGVFLTAQDKRPTCSPWCWLTVSVSCDVVGGSVEGISVELETENNAK